MLYAGVVLCPGTTLLTQKDIALRLEKSAATAVIVHQDLIDVIEKVCFCMLWPVEILAISIIL